ncbi:hypothetical protein [Nostoc sp.]|uniref:hypothetical protein n=1 Tax=Nostoc sp. TaxID=1180 RepID=UPI002FF7CFBF
MKVIQEFLSDYEAGKKSNRYTIGELPKLAFNNQEFDIALCSHLLFLYSDHLDYDFHLYSVGEMLRIAKEVRIFPLITLMWKHSQHLDEIVKYYTSIGYKVDIEMVEYDLQPCGNKMLKITRDFI